MASTKATTPHVDIHSLSSKQLRDLALDLSGKAQDLIDDAVSAKRNLTDGERQEIDDLTLRAEGAASCIERVKRRETRATGASEPSDAFSVQHEDLTRLFGGSGEYNASQKAIRGRAWGEKVVAECSEKGVLGSFKGLTPAGSVLVRVPQPVPVAMGRPVASLRSLIHTEPTDGVFAFLRQTTRQSNAAPVAPGAVKPTSRYTFERVQDRARVIAHLSEPVARQDLADAPLLADFVASEMAWGVEAELEDQVINGDGTGENLQGLVATSGVQTVARIDAASDLGLIRTLRRAITMLDGIGIEGTGFFMSPSDWELVEGAASDGGGDLLLTNAGQAVPVDRAARRLYGLPVVPTPACVPGTAWLGDWTGSTTLYIREEARLDWSEHLWLPDGAGAGIGASLFAKNELVFRSEMRAGFGVTRPSGIVKISLV